MTKRELSQFIIILLLFFYSNHLTIYFEDKPVTFKECEGYDIDISGRLNGGSLEYVVSKDDKEIIRSGSYTSIFNAYYVNHNNIDEIIDHPSVQKSR